MLKPIYISPENGRRYYDNHNIARILQIEKFKTMGLSTADIIEYFNRGGEAADLLKILENKLHDLTRSCRRIADKSRKKRQHISSYNEFTRSDMLYEKM